MENLVVAKIKAGWNWQEKHSPLFSEMLKVKNSAERSDLPNGLYIFPKPMKEVYSLNTRKSNLSVVSLSLSLSTNQFNEYQWPWLPTFDLFRLNEGHTMFVERKITKALHDSEALRQFQALAGFKELKEEIVIHYKILLFK